MAGAEAGAPAGLGARWRGWRNRRIGARGFQRWASAFPLTRGKARRDGERLFDLVAGFVHAQVLRAVIELDLIAATRDAPQTVLALAERADLAPERMEALCQAATALGLFERVGAGYQLAPLGAAIPGVPGLAQMIRHHDVLYRDLADPVALLRGEAETELARFWPYVFGAGAAEDPATAQRYSQLMSDSQTLVAEETLRTVSLKGVKHLMDVGGGTGAFLAATAAAWPGLRLTLFDLPAVVPAARTRFEDLGIAGRAQVVGGSFRDDPLPRGGDAISLVRVFYDHADETVRDLIDKAFDALPPGGRLIVSEPMSGGARPERATDAYFAFYCMAMQTGRVRSQARIAAFLADAGFEDVQTPRSSRPFVTSVVTARRPA